MNGYRNEYDFVLEFNNKKVGELNPLLYDLVYSVFNNIKDDDFIKSWRNHYKQKTDIFLKIGNAIKGISIKMGSRNSVHVESIDSFVRFLLENNIPRNIIDEYLKFHYADGTINNTGLNRLSAAEYKTNNMESINRINKYFNDEKIILKAIDRFILQGNNSTYPIDAIVLGTPKGFLWLTRGDIINVLVNNNNYCSAPHFSELVCQPMNRCLNYNKKLERYRENIQIKWYGLFDSIIKQMNNKCMKKSGFFYLPR